MWNNLSCAVLLVILSVVSGNYEKHPKIITRNGHLFLESGINKNITFRLKGKSQLNINGNDFLNFITRKEATEHIKGDKPSSTQDEAYLLSQINSLRLHLFGPLGLKKSLERMENATKSMQPPSLGQVRRRLIELEGRVQTLYTKLREDPCRSNPCQNGGKCISLYEDFLCECPKQWQGKTCSADVNECAIYAETDLGCQNGAQCINVHGGYSCICNSGWVGLHCRRKKVDCISSGSSELCGHGTCINTNDGVGYTCICDQGWKTNSIIPACIVDVDECTEYKSSCDSKCVNLMGSFACAPCKAGFTGNGFVCTDIDECALNNGGCSTNPFVQCLNTQGSFHCGECPLGWTGDGKNCIHNAGGACSANICHPSAVCSEMSNTVICSCPPHMTGHGVGPHGCSALPQTPCISQPCQNGGSCITNGTSYYCECPKGFSTPDCRRPVSPCSSNPCQNGGRCVSIGDRYRCTCRSGYVGQICERMQSQCGGIVASFSGVLKYPLYEQFDHNVRCAWIIRTTINQVINVTFTMFKMQQSAGCVEDWLQVHDGSTSASRRIGRYCGSELPQGGNIISTTNQLYLWFRSINSTTEATFELSWDSIEPICGGYLEVDSQGTIFSPGYPGNYPVGRSCKWTLVAPPGSHLRLTFFILKIELHDTCNYDFLEIYEGSSENSPLFQKYCTTSYPAPLVIPSSEILINFKSDDEGSDAGFQIHYVVSSGYHGCGGTFASIRGELASPVLNDISQLITCEYIIQQPEKSRIKLNFNRFNLGHASQCEANYIKIYDGTRKNNVYVGKWCALNKPREYKSQSNSLIIRLVAEQVNENQGFKATYEVVCGGLFEEEGFIFSPFYPSNYSDERICTYEIAAPLNKAVKLEFEDFDIEEDIIGKCSYDYLEIFEGVSSAPKEKYCGTRIPSPMISTENYVVIKFHTDISNSGRGFKAKYSFIDKGCGGILTQPNRTISPPMHQDENTYKHSQKCTWTIVAPPGHSVQLLWKSFDLEESTDCLFDFIEIHENYTKVFPVKMKERNRMDNQRYCGQNKPPDVLSIENLITIVFQTDSTDSGEGFLLEYSFVDTTNDCGGRFFSPVGIIRSPYWPNEYPPNKECTWIITVPPKNQVELNIKTFNLEDRTPCADFLEIRNGPSDTYPPIGSYCGSKIPQRIPSLTNQIYIKFVTDETISAAGFEIEWDSTLTGCGGLAVSNTGTITSPNYPQNYNHNAQCEWRIVVSKGSTINIIISDIKLEEHRKCEYDYLEIFDGLSTSSRRLNKYCNSEVPIHLTTTKNEAYLRLVTDFSYSLRGFLLNYTFNCNVEITSLRGVIESPNFPYEYPPDLDCKWIIKAPKGNRISIAFSHFELEDSIGDCEYDYVSLQGIEDRLEKKYCKNMPPLKESASNIITVRFVTDYSVGATGFRLEFKIIGCVDVLTEQSGEVVSPLYPRNYPNDIECRWLIQADVGNSIEFTLLEMDIELQHDCIYDGIKVVNPQNESHVIGQFCGKSVKNNTVTSNGHDLLVKFYSNSVTRGKGFRAVYKTIQSRCGGKLTAPSGFIYSPNYPRDYDPNLNCDWIIEVPEDRTINLTFIEFDLESSSDNCYADAFELYDGSFANPDSLLVRTCDNYLPFPSAYSSNGNHMFIHFRTDSDTEYKGFKLSYEENCGRIIHTNGTGTITLGPFNKLVKECTWTIIAQNLESHVTFTINHFEENLMSFARKMLLQNYTCNSGSISFYDGEDINAPFKKRICSSNEAPVVSFGHALTVKLSPMEVISFEGSYTVFDNFCGGTLKSLKGTFTSPLFPDSYPANIDCIWSIEATEGNSIELSVTSSHIEDSPDCNKDYLEVREADENGEWLASLCGINSSFSGTAKKGFWIKFHSDDSFMGNGFYAQYSYAHHNEIEGSQGRISSPNYPVSILLGEYFSWRITTDVDTVIEIFISDMNEEILGLNKFYDGYDSTAEQFQYLADMRTFVSSTNIVYFALLTGPVLFEWRSIPRQLIPTNGTVDGLCGNIEIGVGETGLNLSSPGYPNGYANNLECNWTLSPINKNDHIVLSVLDINLESYSSCIADYIRILRSNNLIQWTEESLICKMDEKALMEYHGVPYLRLSFLTDHSLNETGFLARISSACGSELNSSAGEIDGTIYSKASSSYNFNCTWKLTVRSGQTIQFTFEEMELSTNAQDTCYSYVLIRNGIDDESPLLGNKKFCGNNTDTLPVSSSNRALVTFVNNSPRRFRWKLRYETVTHTCGKQINLYGSNATEVISSPNYPHTKNVHTECFWIITAPPGKRISIHFIDRFELTYDDECKKEYIEIRDGATALSNSIKKMCGSKPNSVKSTDNVVRITYFTDVSEPKVGFKAEVTIEKCGGTYHQSLGTIASENYPLPGQYPSKSVCEYRIFAPPGTAININFIDIHLPISHDDECDNMDHIELYSPEEYGEQSTDLQLLKKICGFSTIYNETINSNKILIRFLTFQKSLIYRGFKLTYSTTKERCSEQFQTDFGIITSPGYPKGWNKMNRCVWKIMVPKGRRIKVQILDYDFSDTQDLPEDSFTRTRLLFYNDFYHQSQIKNIASDPPQESIYSTDNLMLIFAKMTTYNEKRGLKLSYSSEESTVCRGCLSDECGAILPPVGNLSTYYCEYPFNLSGRETISLTIKNLALSENSTYLTCVRSVPFKVVTWDGLEVFKLCENTTEYKISFPIETAKVHILKNRINRLKTITIRHAIHNCGGVFNFKNYMEIGINSSSNFSGLINCAWQINCEDSEVDHFTFSGFTQFKADCDKEFIVLYNGPFPTSPHLDRYCGDKTIPNITLATGLYVEYVSSNFNSHSDFKLFLRPPEACGGRIVYPFRKIVFKDSYKNNVECIWTVETSKGYRLIVEFVDRFYVEKSDNCTKDYIQISDISGRSNDRSLRACGRNIPPIFKSSSNTVIIKFKSNEQIVGDGFSIQFNRTCGGVFLVSDQRSIMHSPNYPQNYEPYLNCNYTFIAEEDQIILLRFLDFRIESGEKCRYDNITIYTDDYGDPMVYCDADSLYEVRQRHRITILFKTDGLTQDKGFNIEYGLEDCGGIIHHPTAIYSPKQKGDGYYPHNTVCVWNITAPQNNKIVMKFEYIDFEGNSCFYDYIEVYAGSRITTEERLAHMCGNLTMHAPIININNSQAILYSRSDSTNYSKGFRVLIKFSKICDRNIELDGHEKKYEFNMFYNNYENELDCIHIFKAPEDHQVQFEFLNFHVAPCRNNQSAECSCDYLEIRDGAGPFADKIGKFCGHTLPPKIITTKSFAYVRFVTDTDTSSTGFEVLVSSIEAVCGQSKFNLEEHNGTITIKSPGSVIYLPNLRCQWEIFSDRDIHLYFSKFDLQDADYDDKCTSDVLTIFSRESFDLIAGSLSPDSVLNGHNDYNNYPFPNPSLDVPHKFCGSVKISDYYPNSNRVFIKFFTDDQLEKTGFEIVATAVKGCFKNYIGTQGRIHIKTSEDCQFVIRAPENFTLSLYYFSTSLYAEGCDKRKIEVLDAKSNKTLQHLCDNGDPSESLFTNTNELRIMVKSNGVYSEYDITFLASSDGPGCGGQLYNYHGIFTSPFYPTNARNFSDCRWDIQVPQNLKVAIHFLVFDLGAKTTCNSDYLQIIELQDNRTRENVVRQFCGEDSPKFYIGERSYLSVRFRKTVNYDGTGWAIEFTGSHENSPIPGL